MGLADAAVKGVTPKVIPSTQVRSLWRAFQSAEQPPIDEWVASVTGSLRDRQHEILDQMRDLGITVYLDDSEPITLTTDWEPGADSVQIHAEQRVRIRLGIDVARP